MKINFFVGFSEFKYKNPANTLSLRQNLGKDIFCPSFGHKKATLQEKINEFSEENIPVRVLENAKKVIEQGKDDRTISLAQVHYQAYEPLKACTTLEDAKEKFPEFSGVLTIEEALRAPNGNLKKGLLNIKNGAFENQGLTADNAVLAFLKFRYCNEYLEGFDFEENRTLYRRSVEYLKFPELDAKYINYVKANSVETTSAARETLANLRKDSDFRDKSREAARKTMAELNQDPEFRKAMDRTSGNTLRRLWKEEGFREEGIERSRKQMNDFWQNDVFRAIHSEKAHRLMLGFHDSLPENMQNVYKEVAKDFPELAGILTKMRKGKSLSEAEEVIYKKYCKEVHERCPQIKKLQSVYFKKWQSFYYNQVKEEYEKGEFKIPAE